MAAARRPYEALVTCREMVKGMPLERPEIAVPMLKYISNMMWMAAPFRWSVGRLSDTVVVADTVAHTLTSTPSDLLYLLQAQIDDGESTWPLEVVPELPSTKTLAGTPKYVAFVPTATLRIQPPATQLSAGKTRTIRGFYKKVAPTINAITCHAAGQLQMDDEWFGVFEDGVLWRAYLYADDPRSDMQMKAFMGALEVMKQSEPMPDLLKPQADLKKTMG